MVAVPPEEQFAMNQPDAAETISRKPSSFWHSGHSPTLVAALLYFDVSFMVWVLLGPLAPFLREQFGLTATQQGLLVAVPLLGGSLFRPVLGMLADSIGGG